jgi:DNA-binding NarL/FixJ family response regulator
MPTEPAMRVAIADDSLLFRAAAVRLLEDAGFDVVAESGDGDDLLRKVRAHRPDVAIVDIRMPPGHGDEGLRAARTIRAEHPGVGVLVLSQHVEAGQALELLAHGTEGIGYLLKDRVADIGAFADAVRRVARGGTAMDPEVVKQLLVRRTGPLDELTPREHEVLGLVAEGRSNARIAGDLVVSERAVEKHVSSIFAKLRLPPDAADHRRVLAVLAYLAATAE